jgi:hypothetical protein
VLQKKKLDSGMPREQADEFGSTVATEAHDTDIVPG